MDATSSSKQRRKRTPPIHLASTDNSSSSGGGGGNLGRSSPSPISRMEDRFSSATTMTITKSPSHITHEIKNHYPVSVEPNAFIESATNQYFTPMLSSTEPPSRLAVLLSPSRTISETLQSLATITGRQLEEIWDEVGYSPEERSTEINDLVQKFRELCDSKIAAEQHFAATYRQTISEAKEEVRQLSNALKVDVDPQLLSDGAPTQTLIDEHASLEFVLEGLRMAAMTATEDMQHCLTFLIESHNSLGVPIDPKWHDIESDLTMRRREQFHQKMDEMRDELSTRTSAVIQLVRDCQQLIDDLRMDVQKEGSDLDRRIVGSLVKTDSGTYTMVSPKRSETCVGINASALDELTQRLAQLHAEKRRRKGMLQVMGAEIAVLWEKLHIHEDEQMAFTMSVQGLSLETIAKGENELKRLQALKSKMLGNLIHEARETIKQLWELTSVKVEERRKFAPFYVRDDSSMNDDLLEKHEVYIQTLQTRMEQMKPILRLIERREVIVRERVQYDELQKDPERLTQRGAALTKQLMAEERMAIRIKRDLPKLTEKLTETLNEWKNEHQEDFQYNGEVYTEIMARQEDEWRNYKADEAHRKLKKKQDEMNYVENRFVAQPLQQITKRRIGATQPFGDTTANASNVATTSNIESSSTSETKVTNGLYINKPPTGARTNHSYDTATTYTNPTAAQQQQVQKRSLR
jgi:Ase1/PRC1/MAP65 family protein